jgi:SAM-dependent methyltransferase
MSWNVAGRYRGHVDNEAEHRRWNNPAQVATWPGREVLTSAVTPTLLEAADARPGWRVCDIGCGGGALTIALAQSVAPDGEAVGFDISRGLLDLARERAREAACPNARFVERDVQTGSGEDGLFQLAASQFGVMFFDEPTRALRAVRASLVPSGRLVFACWQGVESNPWHVGRTLRPLLPGPATPGPGKSPTGPFAFGDEEYVRELLEAAGYGEVRATAHHIAVRAAASAVTEPALFPTMGIPAARESEATALVERHLLAFEVGPDTYEFPLAFMVYEALA